MLKLQPLLKFFKQTNQLRTLIDKRYESNQCPQLVGLLKNCDKG